MKLLLSFSRFWSLNFDMLYFRCPFRSRIMQYTSIHPNDRGIFLEIRRVISPLKFDGKLENTFLGRGYCYFFFTMSMLDNSGYQTFFISQICTLHLGVLSFHMWLRGLFSVGAAGAAAPTDFWDCYFCIQFFTENIKCSYLVFYKDWENLNYAPQRSTILTRSLLTYVVKKT